MSFWWKAILDFFAAVTRMRGRSSPGRISGMWKMGRSWIGRGLDMRRGVGSQRDLPQRAQRTQSASRKERGTAVGRALSLFRLRGSRLAVVFVGFVFVLVFFVVALILVAAGRRLIVLAVLQSLRLAVVLLLHVLELLCLLLVELLYFLRIWVRVALNLLLFLHLFLFEPLAFGVLLSAQAFELLLLLLLSLRVGRDRGRRTRVGRTVVVAAICR